jgi:hypothetical protein
MGQLHHDEYSYFGSLTSGPSHSSNGRKMPSSHCYCEYEAFASLQILESEVSVVIFKKLFATTEN